MIIPKGYYAIFEPKYQIPSVFDLNKRGMFRSEPSVTTPWGYRILAKDARQVLMQVLCLEKKAVTDPETNQRYEFMVAEALAELDPALKLDVAHVRKGIPDFTYADDLCSKHEEWRKAFVPVGGKGKVDRAALESKIEAAIDEAREKIRHELVRKNSSWVNSAIPRMVQDFKLFLHWEIADQMMDQYKQMGGKSDEEELIKKIMLFHRIVDQVPQGVMEKPDGGIWHDDDEIRECWMGFAGSEKEADRVCQALETVLPAFKSLTV